MSRKIESIIENKINTVLNFISLLSFLTISSSISFQSNQQHHLISALMKDNNIDTNNRQKDQLLHSLLKRILTQSYLNMIKAIFAQ